MESWTGNNPNSPLINQHRKTHPISHSILAVKEHGDPGAEYSKRHEFTEKSTGELINALDNKNALLFNRRNRQFLYINLWAGFDDAEPEAAAGFVWGAHFVIFE